MGGSIGFEDKVFVFDDDCDGTGSGGSQEATRIRERESDVSSLASSWAWSRSLELPWVAVMLNDVIRDSLCTLSVGKESSATDEESGHEWTLEVTWPGPLILKDWTRDQKRTLDQWTRETEKRTPDKY